MYSLGQSAPWVIVQPFDRGRLGVLSCLQLSRRLGCVSWSVVAPLHSEYPPRDRSLPLLVVRAQLGPGELHTQSQSPAPRAPGVLTERGQHPLFPTPPLTHMLDIVF